MLESPQTQSVEVTGTFEHHPESEVKNQRLISTTTADGCYTFEEGSTSQDIPLLSQLDTAYLGQYSTIGGTDTPHSTDSRGHVNQIEGLDDEPGEEGIEKGDGMDWGSYAQEPINPPLDYPPLDYRPLILQPQITISIAVSFYLIGLSIYILMYNVDSTGQFRPTNTYSYFTARYMPSIIGTITTTIYRFLWQEVFRMIPYIAMADYTDRDGARAARSIARRFFPFYFWWDDITICNPMGLPALSFLVPFKTALLSTKEQGGVQVVTVHRLPAWILIVSYSWMGLIVLAVTIWLWDRKTGLKWDPASLADQLALFRNLRTLSYFEKLELKPHMTSSSSQWTKRKFRLGKWMVRGPPYVSWSSTKWTEAKFRLGYWRVGGPNGKVWYGVGSMDPGHYFRPSPLAGSSTPHVIHVDPADDTCRLLSDRETTNIEPSRQCRSVDLQPNMDRDRSPNSKIDESRPAVETYVDDLQVPPNDHCERPNNRCYLYPYRYPPWIDRGLLIFCMLIAASWLIVSLYAIGAGLVRDGFSLENTWYNHFPHLRAGNGNTTINMNVNQTLRPGDHLFDHLSLDPAHDLLLYALVFRSLPTLVAAVFVGFTIQVDKNHSFMQPFVDMYETPVSSTKPNPLLLEYFGGSSLQVPIIAWQNQHWKVVLFSVVKSLTPLFPILVGGLFTITNTGSRIYFGVSLPGFSTMFALLVVYIVSIPFAWPRKNRFIPRRHYTLVDIMAMCHKSHFLWKPEFDISSPETTKQHLAARIFLSGDRYSLGIYKGTDGRWHSGFDIAQDRNEPEQGSIDRLKRWCKESIGKGLKSSDRTRIVRDEEVAGRH